MTECSSFCTIDPFHCLSLLSALRCHLWERCIWRALVTVYLFSLSLKPLWDYLHFILGAIRLFPICFKSCVFYLVGRKVQKSKVKNTFERARGWLLQFYWHAEAKFLHRRAAAPTIIVHWNLLHQSLKITTRWWWDYDEIAVKNRIRNYSPGDGLSPMAGRRAGDAAGHISGTV